MNIDTRPATLPLILRRSASLAAARDVRITAVRGSVWITIDGERRDIVLAPGDSFVADSDRPVFVSALHAGEALEVTVAHNAVPPAAGGRRPLRAPHAALRPVAAGVA